MKKWKFTNLHLKPVVDLIYVKVLSIYIIILVKRNILKQLCIYFAFSFWFPYFRVYRSLCRFLLIYYLHWATLLLTLAPHWPPLSDSDSYVCQCRCVRSFQPSNDLCFLLNKLKYSDFSDFLLLLSFSITITRYIYVVFKWKQQKKI